jgi:hypothetical protein
LDPYNTNAAASAPVDPFEISLTTATQRLESLKAVKLAQDHLRDTRARATKNVEAAEIAVANAIVAADKLGAYALIPRELHPRVPALAAGGAS